MPEQAVPGIGRFHLAADACKVTGATDDADRRRALVELAASDLDAAVIEGQCPLTLEAVLDARSNTNAAVVPNRVHVRIQQWLIECQYVADGVPSFTCVGNVGRKRARISERDQCLWRLR